MKKKKGFIYFKAVAVFVKVDWISSLIEFSFEL